MGRCAHGKAVVTMEVVGILLAAGRGRRFDPGGQRLKLLAPYPSPAAPRVQRAAAAEPLVLAALRSLRAGARRVLAVVRTGDDPPSDALRALLAAAGCELVGIAGSADEEGLGNSIAHGVRASAQARGWIVALADMPAVAPASVAAVRAALDGGAASVVPVFGGRRGHPVGFGAACGAALAALRGDTGARSVLERYPPVEIPVADPGVLFDVDVPADLAAARAGVPDDSVRWRP